MENRLSKVLAAAGVASRRACEELIFEGLVKVNGAVVTLPQTIVSAEKDQILVRNKPIKTEQKIHYILNKPKGYICSHARVGSKKIVYDLFAHERRRLFSIGRLDRDTTGLLILTNDGHFAQQVIHPSSNITKEYLVKTYEQVWPEELETIRKGCVIEGTFVQPVKVQKVRHGTIKVTVKEGKKREVRLLVQNAGLKIYSLKRIRIGGLHLNQLPEGTYRAMTENEKKAIFQ